MRVPFSIPVDPDAETARDWAIEELGKRKYQDFGPSWIEKLWDWVSETLNKLFTLEFDGSSIAALLVVAALGALLYFLVRLTAGPVIRTFRAKRSHSVFEDDTRTSGAMRAAADSAALKGDWNLAVLERYRAVIRSLEERDLIDDRPGVTADEAAVETGRRFPDVLTRMAEAADLFDRVRYGHENATPADDEALRRLDAVLAKRSLLKAAAP